MSIIDQMSHRVLREFAYFMTGNEIGNGMSRVVVAHPSDPDKVIKIENTSGCFQNVKEWELWRDVQFYKDVARWLAPCHEISDSGTFLIMSKAHDLRPGEMPDKIPAFLTDHKLENYGKIGNQVVCRDYGNVIVNASLRMRKWQGER